MRKDVCITQVKKKTYEIRRHYTLSEHPWNMSANGLTPSMLFFSIDKQGLFATRLPQPPPPQPPQPLQPPQPQPPQPFRMLKSHWNKFQICKKSEMHIVLVKNMSNPKWLSSRSKRSYHIDPRTRIKWIWNATVWATLDPQTWKCCPMSSLQNHRTIFRDKHMRSERRRMYNTHLPRIVITNFNVECIGREKTQTINLPWVDPRPVETKLVWTNKCRSLPNMLTWHHQRINALFLSDLFRVSTVSLFFDLCRIWRRRKIK